jgi:hypothetical protein
MLPVSGVPLGSSVAGVSVLPAELISTKPRLCVRSLVSDAKQQRSETPSTAADQSSCNGIRKDTFCSHAFLYLNSLGFKPLFDQDVLNRHIKQLYDVLASCFLSCLWGGKVCRSRGSSSSRRLASCRFIGMPKCQN